MATQNNQNTATIAFPRNVDLGGDVSLVIGPEGCQVRIRVLKALLSFSSKYFNALFSRNFQEGGLAEQGGDVVLAEDEPDALVNLCKILHMQYTWPKPMSPREILHLGIVADKYECVQAIHLTLDALFPRIARTMHGCWEMRDLIVAAYLLDYPDMFNRYTYKMSMSYTKPLSEVALGEMSQRIPIAVWCK